MKFDLSSNYFQLFGLPEQFGVAQDVLAERYRALQQTVHPDRFAAASDSERRQSMQQATRINEAYQVLKDPLSRARYLLELRGVAWDDERDTVVDPEFLMEQMERRETLAEVRGTGDPLAEVGQLLDQVNADIEQISRDLAHVLAEGHEQSLPGALTSVRRLQFLYKFRHEAEELETQLEDEC